MPGEPKGPIQFSQAPTKANALGSKEELKTKTNLLIDKISNKYGLNYPAGELIIFTDVKLPELIEAFGSLDNLKGKRILDLGCGAISSIDAKTSTRNFEPWFCRALHELGADPVGIDISPKLAQEEFENYVLDLSKSGALDIFPDKSFDHIVSNIFHYFLPVISIGQH